MEHSYKLDFKKMIRIYGHVKCLTWKNLGSKVNIWLQICFITKKTKKVKDQTQKEQLSSMNMDKKMIRQKKLKLSKWICLLMK